MGLRRSVATVAVCRDDYHFLRRTLRRLARSKRQTITRTVDRLDVNTGRIDRRRVTRPLRSYTAHQHESGSWVAFNDAPSLLAGLVKVRDDNAKADLAGALWNVRRMTSGTVTPSVYGDGGGVGGRRHSPTGAEGVSLTTAVAPGFQQLDMSGHEMETTPS